MGHPCTPVRKIIVEYFESSIRSDQSNINMVFKATVITQANNKRQWRSSELIKAPSTCSRREARDHACTETTHNWSVGFYWDWMTKWRVIFEPITKSSNARANPKLMWITIAKRTLQTWGSLCFIEPEVVLLHVFLNFQSIDLSF